MRQPAKEVCRVDNNLCLGAVQGVRYRDEVYLLPPFALVRAFLGAEARLLTMIARGDDLRKMYDIEMVDESVVVTPRVRIADRTLKMLIQYNGDPNLRLMLHEMVSHLAVGDCTSDLWIPDVSGKLICKMITVGGYHILLDADAAELPVTYPDIKRVRQQRDKNKIVLPPADKPLLRTPKVDLSAGVGDGDAPGARPCTRNRCPRRASAIKYPIKAHTAKVPIRHTSSRRTNCCRLSQTRSMRRRKRNRPCRREEKTATRNSISRRSK